MAAEGTVRKLGHDRDHGHVHIGKCTPAVRAAPAGRFENRSTGTGRSGARRSKATPTAVRSLHRLLNSSQPAGLSKGDVRRLARRGGIKRMAGGIHLEINTALRDFLRSMVKDVIVLSEHCKRKIVVVTDVLMALKHRGTTLYGYGSEYDYGVAATSRAVPRVKQAVTAVPAAFDAGHADGAAALDAQAQAQAAPDAVVASVTLDPARLQLIKDVIGHIVAEQLQSSDFAIATSELHGLVLAKLAAQTLVPCSSGELEAVFRQLEGNDSIIVVDAYRRNSQYRPRTVYFC